MSDSPRVSNRAKASKPSKPYPDFPLFPHATKRWAKKIRGKLHYFGPWDDPMGALQRFQEQRDDLYAGRTPRVDRDGLTVRHLCNAFLNDRKHRLDAGEIVERTWQEYHKSCERIVDAFGADRFVDDLHADDFVSLRTSLAKTRGPVSLGNEVTRIRVVFKYAYEAGLIEQPIRFGPSFKRPSQKVLRKHRAESSPKRFSKDEIQTLLQHASVQMKGMILLGINCGCGNGDVARLTESSIDVKDAWLDYPRPKSGVARTCPLWPETIDQIKQVLETRPNAKSDDLEGRVFITKYGHSWYKQTMDNPISKEFRKLLDETNLYRKGVGFYALRHTFETEAGETGDQVAVNHIMGHAPASNDMSAVYREGISRERLERVTNHVRTWLFGELD
ncbi:MAG: tyrosine-type recombinase/integrase [Pirellulaceae bacterium]